MRATELMVGDWLYNKFIEKNMQVYPMMLSQMFGQTPEATTEVYSIFPIPLTPEILEKNGFIMIDEKDKCYRWEYAEGVYVNADFKSEEPWVSIHNKCYYATPVCRYVHELQHALRMCGIEKEIIL